LAQIILTHHGIKLLKH